MPDVPAVRRAFDYLVPDELRADVRVGTVVRIDLHGRRVRGWVVDLDVEPPAGVALKPVAKVTGWGPPPEVIDLCRWTAHRWAGRTEQLLGTSTAERAVTGLPGRTDGAPVARPASRDAGLVSDAWHAARRRGV
ncbi:MAG: hypothetical protein KDB36_02875, partial [Acidimicrobiales bacterium]|nr:hypothetical protein [Acidimicrobiales bacterium]